MYRYDFVAFPIFFIRDGWVGLNVYMYTYFGLMDFINLQSLLTA